MTKLLAESVRQTTHTPASEVRNLTAEVAQACLDAKGMDIAVLDVSSICELADYFVVVSGRSDRHVQGIVNRILENLELRGMSVDSVEGYEAGHWVILDFCDVVVHVFYQHTRDTYDLESLWVKAKRLAVHREAPTGELELRAA